MLTASASASREGNFITEMISKLESQVKPGDNPMDAIGSFMKPENMGNMVNDMQKGLEDGSLNIGGLLNVVSGMIGTIKEQEGGREALGMVNGLLSGMLPGLASANGAGSNPDISNILNMLKIKIFPSLSRIMFFTFKPKSNPPSLLTLLGKYCKFSPFTNFFILIFLTTYIQK